MADPRPRLGFRASVRSHEGLHDARVPGAALQPRLAQRAQPSDDCQPGADEDRRHHLRRRCGRAYVAGNRLRRHFRLARGRVLGDRGRTRLYHGPVYRPGRFASDHVHRGSAGPRVDSRILVHSLCGLERAGAWRSHCRLARDDGDRWLECTPHSAVERPRLVLGRRAAGVGDHRLLVLVHRSIHRAACAGRKESA